MLTLPLKDVPLGGETTQEHVLRHVIAHWEAFVCVKSAHVLALQS